MKGIFGLFLLGTSASILFAHPVAPGASHVVKNADGSEVTLQYFGDEHYHYATTEDGFLVVQDSGSYRYLDNDGKVSREIARDARHRNAKQKKFLNGLQRESVKSAHKKRSSLRYPETFELQNNLRRAPANNGSVTTAADVPAPRKRATGESWVNGERWIPVLLMGSTDKAYADSADIYALLNQKGYNKDGNIGSLRDYYIYSSNGKFEPHFDVYPVNVGKALTDYSYQGTDYYGNYGARFNEGKFIADAIDILTARADFKDNGSKYCSSGKAVDGFIALFPGKEEDALKISEDFWGHQYWMQYNGAGSSMSKGYAKNGYTFNSYLFIAQKADALYGGESKLNIMGIFAHEFSHVLGLPDLYNVNTGNGGPTPYDVMTQGMYNSRGNTPPAFSAFEMETMGWLTLKELSPDDTISLKNLAQGEAYSVTNPNQNDEYYVVEYRPSVSYDSYIGENGIYLWYIDYDYTAFVTDNNPNGNSSHLRVDIAAVVKSGKSADGLKYVNKNGVAKVSGIYSVVFDGSNRACFTTNSTSKISACPAEEVVSSSSQSAVTSSASVPASSGSAVPESSTSAKSSSSGQQNVSSSSEGAVATSSSDGSGILETAVTPRNIQMWLEGGALQVVSDSDAPKKIAVFDLLGNRILIASFSNKNHRLDLAGLGHKAYMIQIVENGRVALQKKVIIATDNP